MARGGGGGARHARAHGWRGVHRRHERSPRAVRRTQPPTARLRSVGRDLHRIRHGVDRRSARCVGLHPRDAWPHGIVDGSRLADAAFHPRRLADQLQPQRIRGGRPRGRTAGRRCRNPHRCRLGARRANRHGRARNRRTPRFGRCTGGSIGDHLRPPRGSRRRGDRDHRSPRGDARRISGRAP